ncbi:hypothetical protein SG34_009515 [Thalassomonas viridans]|uniref:Uncharacterized protein n=1 Tax=Thalassomonas viridans TaxID=137584 RepID=A0AAE9Z5G7_9GAMM|nr:hypothetical protein [Thalassomonas viridans]WDE07101.1 hypothetical protein SG34_009515 [Thalassomonas viridans]
MSDFNSGAETERDLGREVFKLMDEFEQFNGKSSFLCDAFAAVAANPECIDELTSYGLDFYAIWLKSQISDFNGRIRRLHEQVNSQQEN